MKGIVIVIGVVASCVSSSRHVWAQDCKPTVSRQDKISKEHVDIWFQELFATGFGASLMSTSEVSITATVGRYGARNAINLQIQKREESATNAAFESAYRAAKGNPFHLGLKNGAPVALVVTEVSNSANVQQGLLSAKGVTTVVLAAVVSDQELAGLREALTSRQIDAVRITLAGDQQIEKSVNDKNGKRMMEKFSCFYQSLDKKGIVLSTADPKDRPGQPASPNNSEKLSDSAAPVPSQELKSMVGAWVMQSDQSNQLQLNPDGTFLLHQLGRDYQGRFTVDGGKIFIQQNGQKPNARPATINGELIVDPSGSVWKKKVVIPQEPPPPPTPPKTISVGDTTSQVLENLGQPEKVIDLGAKKIFVYKDLKITFVDGKVSDVQ